MDIFGSFSNINNSKTAISQNKSNPLNRVESSLKLPSNGIVKGEIIDVNNKSIKIKVGDQIISGNLNLEGKLNIGDIRDFLIELDGSKLKMTVMAESTETLTNMHLENVLKELGELSKENLKLAKMLLENNLPVNKESLGILKRSMALFGKNDKDALDKSLLMMKNEIDINSKSTENLNNILDRDNNITNNLKTIDTLLNTLEHSQPELVTQIKDIFSNILDDLTKNTTTNNLAPEQATTDVQNLDNPKDLLDIISKGLDLENIDENNEQVLLKNSSLEQNKDLDIAEKENSAKFKLLNDALNNIETTSNKDDLTSILLNKLNKNAENKELVSELANNILDTSDEELSIYDNLKKVLTEPTESLDTDAENISKTFEIDKNIKTPKDLENHINEKLEKLEKALEVLKNSPKDSETLKLLEKEITIIKDKLTFTNELKNNVYVQIPFTLNNKTTNGELIVFKDKKAKKNSKGYASALVSLDTANLGLFEAYLLKKNSNIDIQFRFKEDFVKDLVQKNLYQLNNILSSKNIMLSNVTYKKIDEPFSLINKEPVIDIDDNIQENEGLFKLDIRG